MDDSSGRQLLQFSGCRGVAGLGLLRLGQIEVIEQHLLQLFWAGEVQRGIPASSRAAAISSSIFAA